jgi:polyisoprenoid-binding protein YceI
MRLTARALTVAAMLQLPALAGAQIAYVLDGTASRVAFQGRALFQSIDGQSDDVVGTVTVSGRDLRSLRGTIRVSVASLQVQPEISAREIERLFGGHASAEIVFRVDSLSRQDAKHINLHGRLTMNGVTRPVTFSGEAHHEKGSRLHARGSARVDIREWQMRPPKRLLGLISMHHELTLTFDARFSPQELAHTGDIMSQSEARDQR